MKGKKSKILIIEKSSIIRMGLVKILFDKNNKSFLIDEYEEDCDLEMILTKIKPQLLIGCPSIFKENKAAFKQKYNVQIVGLIYTYHHPDKLTDFDALIHLNDTPKKIRATVDKLLNDNKPTDATATSLSARETEVLKWLTSGYSTKKIADTLFISTHTVNAHRKNIMRKLDIKTVSGLTIYAVLNNIISLKEV